MMAATGNGERPRPRVIVVDDDPAIRDVVRFLLELEDVPVVADAADGWEALSASKRLAPDVVIIDYRLPTMSGKDTVRVLRNAVPGVKVIAFSAADVPGWTEWADDFLVKTQVGSLPSRIERLTERAPALSGS